MFTEIIAAYCEKNTEPTGAVVDCLTLKHVAYSHHFSLKRLQLSELYRIFVTVSM
jgi:hypothetical protein